jgi:hypothetical protein
VVVGAGGAFLGGALGFELARRSEESDAGSAQTQIEVKEHLDAMDSRKTAARVLVGIGGALVVTGGVLLLFNDRSEQPPAQVGFSCLPGGCLAAARGSF